MPDLATFPENLALYNKDKRVLLSQALCVRGSLGNLMFKLHMSYYLLSTSNFLGSLSRHSAFDRRILLFNWSAFQMSVVKPKPITTNTNYLMSQSELKANTCNRRQARENACKQVVIGLSFTSDWSTKRRQIFLTYHRVKFSLPRSRF